MKVTELIAKLEEVLCIEGDIDVRGKNFDLSTVAVRDVIDYRTYDPNKIKPGDIIECVKSYCRVVELNAGCPGITSWSPTYEHQAADDRG